LGIGSGGKIERKTRTKARGTSPKRKGGPTRSAPKGSKRITQKKSITKFWAIRRVLKNRKKKGTKKNAKLSLYPWTRRSRGESRSSKSKKTPKLQGTNARNGTGEAEKEKKKTKAEDHPSESIISPKKLMEEKKGKE